MPATRWSAYGVKTLARSRSLDWNHHKIFFPRNFHSSYWHMKQHKKEQASDHQLQTSRMVPVPPTKPSVSVLRLACLCPKPKGVPSGGSSRSRTVRARYGTSVRTSYQQGIEDPEVSTDQRKDTHHMLTRDLDMLYSIEVSRRDGRPTTPF